MTRIVWRDVREYQEMYAQGHAGTAEAKGTNIVCAGISAIMHTLCENLRLEEERGQIRADCVEGDGEMWIRAWTKDENRDAIRNMFRFTITGLREIEGEYPDRVKIEEE